MHTLIILHGRNACKSPLRPCAFFVHHLNLIPQLILPRIVMGTSETIPPSAPLTDSVPITTSPNSCPPRAY